MNTPAQKHASKAAFVRAYPNLSAKEVVAKAKEHGVKMGEPYVYNVRTYDKNKGARRAGGRRAPGIARPSTVVSSSAESLLKAVAAEVGLGRAIEILQGERAQVHAMMRG